MNRQSTFGIFVALVAVIVLGRALPHVPNFAPVAAAGLLAGYAFRSRILAMGVPLLGMLVSDLFFVGTYDWRVMGFVYAGLIVPVLAGNLLQKPTRASNWVKALKLGGVVTASSLFFFTVSNFGTWLFGGMYAPTFEGMLVCYTVALPFLKVSLAADLLFSAALFGMWHVAQALSARRAVAVSSI